MRSFSIHRKRLVIAASVLILAAGIGTAPALAGSSEKHVPSDPAASGADVSAPDAVIAQAGSNSSGHELLPGGDTRSERLRASTRSWNTDWSRRTIELYELLHGGPPRDGIPSIDDPSFVSPRDAAPWLGDTEPVIALIRGDDARAYPLQILIWHEVVNDVIDGDPVLITFCPLCNSSIVFDRRVEGKVYEFGTSGLLRNSDLVMYDRSTESLWQQLTGEGIVGAHAGDRLTFIPSSIVSFDEFRTAYPDGVVLSKNTGYARNYGSNPYVGYDAVGQSPFLFTGEVDGRLTAMERVVAVTLNESGREVDVAYPYSLLERERIIEDERVGTHLVVFYESGTSSALDAREISNGRDVGATGVFNAEVDGELLSFTVTGGDITDTNTGSRWDIFGRSVEGSLKGTRLEPIVHGNHFWFAWAAFKPDTIVYGK